MNSWLHTILTLSLSPLQVHNLSFLSLRFPYSFTTLLNQGLKVGVITREPQLPIIQQRSMKKADIFWCSEKRNFLWNGDFIGLDHHKTVALKFRDYLDKNFMSGSNRVTRCCFLEDWKSYLFMFTIYLLSCVRIEPGTAGWEVQTLPLGYAMHKFFLK